MLQRLAGTVRAAAAVFMTEDARAARLLVAEKEAFREMEAAATAAHFARLRGTAGAEQASALNLDLLRELKRVNSHLVRGGLPGAGGPGRTAAEPVAGRAVKKRPAAPPLALARRYSYCVMASTGWSRSACLRACRTDVDGRPAPAMTQ